MKKNNKKPNKSDCFFSLSLIYLGILMHPLPLRAADTATEGVEFDPNFLRHSQGKSVIDVRRFSKGNPVPPGMYNSDIYINGKWKGRSDLKFTDVDGTGGAILCLTPSLLSISDVVPAAIAKAPDDNMCVTAAQGLPDARTRFDLSSLRLDIEIPQALIIPRPRGYISPAQWQTGVPAAFIKYNMNHYQYSTSVTDSHQTYLGLRTGFNIAGWALRHRGSESWNKGHDEGYQSIETNLQHDIAVLRAQLTIGDFSTSGELMDSASLRGVRLASDDRMLPGSLRGYAPVVRGVADSNARVTIRQNDNIIYETTVPAGPFTISDLYPTGYGGDLFVTVTESGGRVRTFTVPFAAVAQLVRPGYSRWQISAGRYRYGNETYNDTVFQGAYQYGLTNDLTLNSGLTTVPHYFAGLGGLAFNTPFGAVASDITLSRTTFTNSDSTRKGYSLHASYSVRIPESSTNISLAAYRYSSKDFYNLKDAMLANKSAYIDDVSIKGAAFYRPKNQFQLSVNQELGQGLGSLYMNGATYQYWGRTGYRNEYQMGYSNFWKRLSYQVGFSQARDNENHRRDNRVYLNFSLPLGKDTYGPMLSSTLNYNKNAGNSTQTSLSGVGGEEDQYTYGVTASTQESGPTGYSVNGGYRSPYTNLTATAGSDSAHNSQMSIGASGAVVAHPHGVTLSNDLSDTFTIIHAEGAHGAVINNAPGNRLDYWGNGIVPYVTPYEKNDVSIDPSRLPMDIGISATAQEVIPAANSATLVTFSTQTGNSTLFEVSMPDGSLPPMASEVFNEQGQSMGYIAQGGRLFARGLTERGRASVVWGQNEKCEFSYHTENKRNKNNGVPVIQKVLCDKVK